MPILFNSSSRFDRPEISLDRIDEISSLTPESYFFAISTLPRSLFGLALTQRRVKSFTTGCLTQEPEYRKRLNPLSPWTTETLRRVVSALRRAPVLFSPGEKVPRVLGDKRTPASL